MSQLFLSANFLLFFCFVIKYGYGFDSDLNPGLLQSLKERMFHETKKPGKFQSPISIDTKSTKKIQLRPLNFENFDEIPSELNVTNSGHTLQVSGVWEKWRIPTISGGNLKHQYKFVQFHFHWSKSNFSGSDHVINNVTFPSELHAVFIRYDLNNIRDATQYANGIVVVSNFISISPWSDQTWHPLTQAVPSIKTTLESVKIRPSSIDSFLDLDFLNENYFTYIGSLTAPPYSENVRWIIAANSGMIISPKQLDAFRSLLGEDGKPILENHRQLQDLNGRTIYNVQRSFGIDLLD